MVSWWFLVFGVFFFFFFWSQGRVEAAGAGAGAGGGGRVRAFLHTLTPALVPRGDGVSTGREETGPNGGGARRWSGFGGRLRLGLGLRPMAGKREGAAGNRNRSSGGL